MLVQVRERVLFALLVSGSMIFASCSTEPSASPTPGASEVAGATATPGVESAAPGSTSTPAPEATPTTTMSPWPVSTIFTSWTRSDLPERISDINGANQPDDMTWFADRYVAVGGITGGCCAIGSSTDTQTLVWRSRDGVAWNLVPDSESFDMGYMRAVAANETRVVAVGVHVLDSAGTGEAARVGATWSSTDGRSWRMVWGSVPLFVDVVATDDGFLAATESGDRPAPAIWHTTDGLEWTRVAAPGELGDGVINRLIRTPDGFLAVGTSVNTLADPDSTSVPRAAVWSSVDGLAWARVADQPAFEDGTISDVAVRDGRYVAVGHGAVYAGGEIWLSDDAQTWQRLDDPAFQAEGIQTARVFALPAGFIVGGVERVGDTWEFLAWTTTDGSSWAVIPDQAAFDGTNVTVTDLLEIDGGGALAVGSYVGADGSTPASWSIR